MPAHATKRIYRGTNCPITPTSSTSFFLQLSFCSSSSPTTSVATVIVHKYYTSCLGSSGPDLRQAKEPEAQCCSRRPRHSKDKGKAFFSVDRGYSMPRTIVLAPESTSKTMATTSSEPFEQSGHSTIETSHHAKPLEPQSKGLPRVDLPRFAGHGCVHQGFISAVGDTGHCSCEGTL